MYLSLLVIRNRGDEKQSTSWIETNSPRNDAISGKGCGGFLQNLSCSMQ